MLTPLPRYGPSIPSHRAEAPVATISASHVYSRMRPARGIAAGIVGRPHPERPLRQIDLEDGLPPAVRAEPLGLLPHQVHQIRAHDPVGEAREIVHGRGQRQLAARLLALEYQGCEIGPRRVKSGGQAGRTRADDDHCGVRLRHRTLYQAAYHDPMTTDPTGLPSGAGTSHDDPRRPLITMLPYYPTESRRDRVRAGRTGY